MISRSGLYSCVKEWRILRSSSKVSVVKGWVVSSQVQIFKTTQKNEYSIACAFSKYFKDQKSGVIDLISVSI